MSCERRLVEAQLVVSRLLLRLAAELLKQAMILSDGRLPSWRIIDDAYEKVIEAYVEMERELETLTGHNTVLNMLERVVAGAKA